MLEFQMPPNYDNWIILVQYTDDPKYADDLYIVQLTEEKTKKFELRVAEQSGKKTFPAPPSSVIHNEGSCRYWMTQIEATHPTAAVAAYLASAYTDYIREKIDFDKLTEYQLHIMPYDEIIKRIRQNIAEYEQQQEVLKNERSSFVQ